MNDELDGLLGRLDVRLRTFFAGKLCGLANVDPEDGTGHVHFLRRGQVTLHAPDATARTVTGPSVVYFPEGAGHRMQADEKCGAELVCASVQYDAHFTRALVQALPAAMVVPLCDLPRLDGVLQVMFAEAFDGGAGCRATLDRLCEVVLLNLLRWALDRRLVHGGVVVGLADARLAKALGAIHNEPARQWTLEELADRAGLSRARFAARFAEVVGQPPGEYLAVWRVAMAQTLLSRGRQLKSIADECGYGSANALSRAFVQHVGMRPTDWLARRRLPVGVAAA